MKLTAVLLALLPMSLPSQVIRRFPAVGAASASSQVYSGGNDFVSDLTGSPDKNFWGSSGFADETIQFNPPAGFRTRIISADVTVSSYAHGAVPVGTHAGASFGLVTTDQANSPRANLLNDHCMAYVKQSISSTKDSDTTSAHFDIQNGLLGADNKLIARNAVYLNETGLPIHTEVALIIAYTFEPMGDAQ